MHSDSQGRPQASPPEHDPTGLIVNSLPGLFYLFRSSDGRMLRWNRNLERFSGHHADVVATKTPLELLDERDHGAAQAAIETALATGFGDFEARVIRADDTRVPHYFAGTALHWDGERCICGLGIDISARRRAEAELARTRDRLIDAIESMSEAFAYYDADDRLQLFNTKYRAWHPISAPMIEVGRSYKEILQYGAERGEYVHAVGREREWVGERLRWRRTHKDEPLEIELDGGRWLRIQERLTADGGMVGVRADITQIKQREQRLRESEERYRGLVELSPDGVLVIVDGRLRFVNRAGVQLSGARSPSELLDRPLSDFVRADQQATLYERLQQVGAGDQIEPLEYELHRLDGEVAWVEASAVPIHYQGQPAALAVVRDITERKRVEARYRALFESARDAIVIADAESGTIIDVNTRAEQLFGRARDELVGRSQSVLHPPERAQASEETFRSHVDAGGAYPLFSEALGADGQRIPVEINTSLVRDPDGRLLAQGLFRDITDRRRREQRAADRNRVLELIARDAPLAETLDEIADTVERQCGGVQARVLVNVGGALRPAGGGPGTVDAARLGGDDEEGGAAGDAPVVLPATALEDWPGLAGDTPVVGQAVLDGNDTLVGAVIVAGAAAPEEDIDPAYALEHDALAEATKLAAIAIEQQQLTEQLAWQAHHDTLTGLPNRALLMDRLQQSIARNGREGRGVALILLDLDDFKIVNDSMGHSAGDRLLQEMGERLHQCTRSGDTVARLGGDEFVLVLPQANTEVATRVAEKILNVLRAPVQVAGQEVMVTPSLGITLFPDDGDTPEALLQAADTAMYAAKHAGRDCFRFFARTMNVAVSERQRLEGELRDALARRDGLTLRYQPRIRLADGGVVAGEALLRWHHPERGPLTPADFLRYCDHGDLVAQLDRWVLHEACGRAAAWAASGHGWRVAVNLAARDLEGADIVETVTGALETTGVPASVLELEITEVTLARDRAGAIEQLRLLRERLPGLRIALDDFGRDRASLAHLRDLPIDTLKIDRRVVHELTGDSSARALLASILELGRNLGLEVVAEGVEQLGQHRTVAELGCHTAQGFYYSAPLTAAAFEAWASGGFSRPFPGD